MNLPDKLSDLLELAVNDVEKVRVNPKFKLFMNVWYRPSLDKEICYVCMSGAVMAMSLGACREKELYPDDFPDEIETKLETINCMRSGKYTQASFSFYPYSANEWRINFVNGLDSVVPSKDFVQNEIWEVTRARMEIIINYLKLIGL